LVQSGAGESAPKPGEVMPSFLLPDETGRLVNSDDLLARGPLAITFHRGHWCPYCRINLKALVDAQPEIAETGGQLVAIVPDAQEYASEFKSDSNAPFPILIDVDNGYAMSLNLAIWLGEEMQRLLQTIGRALPQYQGNDAWMVPIPATFVVGTDGRITARFVDPDYRKRMAIEDLLSGLRGAR